MENIIQGLLNNQAEPPSVYEFGREMTTEEYEKEMKRQLYYPCWMKLFIGGNNIDTCKHGFGFLRGVNQICFSRMTLLSSYFGLVVDSWSFLLNLLLMCIFFFTYRLKDKSDKNEITFKINLIVFYSVNAFLCIYSYINAWFVVEFQKASRFQTYGVIFWFLYWINQGVDTFYKDEPLYTKYNFYYDIFVLAFYALAAIVMWVRLCKSSVPRNDVQYLGLDADCYSFNFHVLHWKVLVVLFNWRLKEIFHFSEYYLFSTLYAGVLFVVIIMFIEMRIKDRRYRNQELMTIKGWIWEYLKDFSCILLCAFYCALVFGYTYVMIQFYRHKTWWITGLIATGIIVTIALAILLIFMAENKTNTSQVNADGVKYGYYKSGSYDYWHIRYPNRNDNPNEINFGGREVHKTTNELEAEARQFFSKEEYETTIFSSK